MIRLKDIAEVCGVSVATVSRALNGVTDGNRERTTMICQTAREMGYFPNAAARTLKTSRSNNIGILYEDRMDHEHFSSLLDELREKADERGYDITIIGRGTGEDAGNYLDHVRRRNLDGVVVIQADFESANVSRLATSDIPSVIIDHAYEGCDCVSGNNRTSMEELVRFAWEKGHRRIATIQGEAGAVSRERLAGYYKICAELGIRVPDGFVREGHYHNPESCTAVLLEMMHGSEKPSCVLCPDDYSLLGAMIELSAMGIRIPEDISLIGYDGITMSRMIRPRLTTYQQNTAEIARQTVELLAEAIEDPEGHTPRQITVNGTLAAGETVGELTR